MVVLAIVTWNSRAQDPEDKKDDKLAEDRSWRLEEQHLAYSSN